VAAMALLQNDVSCVFDVDAVVKYYNEIFENVPSANFFVLVLSVYDFSFFTFILWSPYGIGQTIIFLPCGFFFFFFFLA